MLYTQKTFNSHGPKQVDPRRDCAIHGHGMPRKKGEHYVCFFCGKPCQVDGTDREPTP